MFYTKLTVEKTGLRTVKSSLLENVFKMLRQGFLLSICLSTCKSQGFFFLAISVGTIKDINSPVKTVSAGTLRSIQQLD